MLEQHFGMLHRLWPTAGIGRGTKNPYRMAEHFLNSGRKAFCLLLSGDVTMCLMPMRQRTDSHEVANLAVGPMAVKRLTWPKANLG